MQQNTLFLFDFDGTLTKRDSLSHFLLFAVPPHILLYGSLLLSLRFFMLLLSGKWSNERAKEAVFSVFFKGKNEAELQATGMAFCRQKIPQLLRNELLDKLRECINAGASVALVSASVDLYLRAFCEEEKVRMICTELEFPNGIFSGKFATPNCNGAEKARRIRAGFDLSAFDKIVAFGNSAGDHAMFALADEAWLLRNGKLVRYYVDVKSAEDGAQ